MSLDLDEYFEQTNDAGNMLGSSWQAPLVLPHPMWKKSMAVHSLLTLTRLEVTNSLRCQWGPGQKLTVG